MSRPSAKLCASCSPALRPRGRALRSATPTPLRVRSLSYTTAPTTATIHSSPLFCSHPRVPHAARATGLPVNGLRLQRRARGLATATSEGAAGVDSKAGPVDGPMKEYDVRVEEGRLRDDPYQRGELR